MTSEEILQQLNPAQREAVSTLNGPVLVLAGAGTGKTRVITYRIAYMLSRGIAPEAVLGMTFTNKAAREMRERLAHLVDPELASQVTLGTFHSFCGRLLRREITKLNYTPNFTIADESDQQGIFKQAIGNVGCGGSFPAAAAFALMSRWKNQLITPKAARDAADSDFAVMAGNVYEEYQELLERQNLVDFDDMLMLTCQIFQKFPEVLARYQERYCYLMVDEYQDTNTAQFVLVQLLSGERRNLCVVGDDDQSIYSWRGAEVENILNFPDSFPGTKVVKLEQNYRSCNAILDAANAVISQGNAKRHDKRLWSELGQGRTPEILTLDNGEAEADFVADLIMQRRGELNCDYRSFAVLYRSNQLSRQLEQSFRRVGIPYRMFGGQQFFQRREIKDALAYLRVLANPSDDQSFLRVLTAPPRGIGAKAIAELKSLAASRHTSLFRIFIEGEFLDRLTKAGRAAATDLSQCFKRYRAGFAEPGNLAEKCSGLLRDAGYVGGLQKIYKDLEDATKRRENVDEFISAIAQFEQKHSSPVTLDEYLETCALMEESDRQSEQDPDPDAVTLSTVHAAKGLEFPIVMLIAVEQGMFPHERALDEGNYDEEKRLFYVAITRAKQELYLLHARCRMQRGINKPARPSNFLALLTGDLAEAKAPEDLLKPVDRDRMAEKFAELYNLLKSGR